jgi:hypothetical protein
METYQEKLKSMPDLYLRYTIRDIKMAIKNLPNSPDVDRWNTQLNFCFAEVYRRKKRKSE